MLGVHQGAVLDVSSSRVGAIWGVRDGGRPLLAVEEGLESLRDAKRSFYSPLEGLFAPLERSKGPKRPQTRPKDSFTPLIESDLGGSGRF